MGGGVAKSGKSEKGDEKGGHKSSLLEDPDGDASDSEDEEYQMEKAALAAMKQDSTTAAASYQQMHMQEIVYTNFSDQLRAGYATRVAERNKWVDELEAESERKQEEEERMKATVLVAPIFEKPTIKNGVATAHKRIPGWPAGGMHEHGW
eukprot:gb/GFBE01019107.1/.p1 GENE.gb/GFBE01019107.1/~~gb/GFBE01019107.1/.p1  ORF type:complete len:150 (+),score=36.79 gb/GFBE01019107.1/:1-450(+)